MEDSHQEKKEVEFKVAHGLRLSFCRQTNPIF